MISDELPDRQPRQSLNQLFDELNGRWFDGRLRRRKVRWATFRNPHQRGVCPPGPKPILIVRGMSPAGVAAILLHEMCHIGCPSHGRRFTARIARLKHLGAPIPKYEFNYDRRPIGSVVAGYIDDAIVNLPEFLAWKRGRAIIAWHMGWTAAELDRKCPWARLRWRRRLKEERRYRGTRKRSSAALDEQQIVPPHAESTP